MSNASVFYQQACNATWGSPNSMFLFLTARPASYETNLLPILHQQKLSLPRKKSCRRRSYRSTELFYLFLINPLLGKHAMQCNAGPSALPSSLALSNWCSEHAYKGVFPFFPSTDDRVAGAWTVVSYVLLLRIPLCEQRTEKKADTSFSSPPLGST